MYIKKSIFDPSIREIESMTNSSDPSLLFPSPSFLICDGEFQTEDNKTGGQYMCYVSSRLCAVFFFSEEWSSCKHRVPFTFETFSPLFINISDKNIKCIVHLMVCKIKFVTSRGSRVVIEMIR